MSWKTAGATPQLSEEFNTDLEASTCHDNDIRLQLMNIRGFKILDPGADVDWTPLVQQVCHTPV